MTFGQVVQACLPTFAGPGVASPDFQASAYEPIETVTYTNAVHVAQVEVDPANPQLILTVRGAGYKASRPDPGS